MIIASGKNPTSVGLASGLFPESKIEGDFIINIYVFKEIIEPLGKI